MIIKIRKGIDDFYYIIMLSIFLTGTVVRKSFLPGFWGTANLVFLICELLVLITALKWRKLELNGIFLGILLISLILYVDIDTHSNMSSVISSIMYFVFPLFLMDAEVLLKIDEKNFVVSIIKILNFFVLVNVVIMVCDQLSGCAVTRLMSRFFPYISNYLPSSKGFLQFRANTYLGHELYITHFIIVFYALNMLYITEFSGQILSSKIVHVVALFGIAFTQSKMGILLLFMLIAYFNVRNKNKFTNILLAVIGIGMLYYLGIFGAVIERFQNTSFTTGRTTWLTYLINYYGLEIRFLGGYGEALMSRFRELLENSHSISWSNMIVTAAFDSPVLILIFRYGILVAILWMIKAFWKTFKIICKTRNLTIFICYICIVAQVLSFNQLIFNPDLVCCILIWNVTFIELSRYKINLHQL